MDIIRTYLENMFLNLPNTLEVLRAKEELYSMMEDKYNELKAAGKSENEAIGTVIAEFGNLDELAETLGLAPGQTADADTASSTDPIRTISADEADDYLQFSRKSALRVALGVMLCILSPVPLICLGGMTELTTIHLSEGAAAFTGLMLLFLLVAAAVALFIIYGTREDHYKHLKKEPFRMEISTLSYVGELHSQFRASFSVQVSVGVALCILSVIPLLGSSLLFPARQWLILVCVCLLLILVGIGVFLLVHTGMISESFHVLMQDAEYTPQNKTAQRAAARSGILASYWSIITLIYLGVSFLFDNWHISWIIWIIAGIFEPILRTIVNSKRAGK